MVIYQSYICHITGIWKIVGHISIIYAWLTDFRVLCLTRPLLRLPRISYTIHIPFIYLEYIIHITGINHSYIIHITWIYHSYIIHITWIYHSYNMNIKFIYYSYTIHITITAAEGLSSSMNRCWKTCSITMRVMPGRWP